jgi:hypothetical protein
MTKFVINENDFFARKNGLFSIVLKVDIEDRENNDFNQLLNEKGYSVISREVIASDMHDDLQHVYFILKKN